MPLRRTEPLNQPISAAPLTIITSNPQTCEIRRYLVRDHALDSICSCSEVRKGNNVRGTARVNEGSRCWVTSASFILINQPTSVNSNLQAILTIQLQSTIAILISVKICHSVGHFAAQNKRNIYEWIG